MKAELMRESVRRTIEELENILDGYKEARTILTNTWTKTDELVLHPVDNADEYVRTICCEYENIKKGD